MAPSSFGSSSPSLASTRARSRSCRSLKKPLVSLRPRDSVGDGDGPRLPVPGPGPSAVVRSSALLKRGLRPHALSTGCHFFKDLSSFSFFRFRSVLGEVYSETPMILTILLV